MSYDIDIELIKKEVKPGMKVLIQLPAGLRTKFLEVTNAVIQAGGNPIIWAGSCYGACDLPDYSKADLLIHFGHSKFKC